MEENTTTEVKDTSVVDIPKKIMDTQQVKVLTAPTADYSTCTTLAAIADIRADVRDVEADVKERVSISDNQRQVAELNLHNRLCDAEKAAIEAKWAGITQTKDSEMHLKSAIDHCCEEQTEALTAFKDFVAEKFCEIEKTRLQDEIDELREEKEDGINAGTLSTLNAILAKIK